MRIKGPRLSAGSVPVIALLAAGPAYADSSQSQVASDGGSVKSRGHHVTAARIRQGRHKIKDLGDLDSAPD